jgi:hypothetical protein
MSSITDAQKEFLWMISINSSGPLAAEVWDKKLRNDIDTKFVAEVDGYRFVKIIAWPTFEKPKK